MRGASGDAHLHIEVSGACRGLSCVLEALRRNGRVHIYSDVRAELLQLAFFFFSFPFYTSVPIQKYIHQIQNIPDRTGF